MTADHRLSAWGRGAPDPVNVALVALVLAVVQLVLLGAFLFLAVDP